MSRSNEVAQGIRRVAVCAILAGLPACVPPSQDAGTARRLAQAEKQVKKANEDISKLRDELKSLQLASSVDDVIDKMHRTAFLTPGDSGYSVVQSDLGALTIALENVESYANGSRVLFSIGNPLSSTINGLSAKVEWGRLDERGLIVEESLRSKKITLPQPLRAGSWNYSSFVLDGVPPEQLGFVRVSELSHTGIQLGR